MINVTVIMDLVPFIGHVLKVILLLLTYYFRMVFLSMQLITKIVHRSSLLLSLVNLQWPATLLGKELIFMLKIMKETLLFTGLLLKVQDSICFIPCCIK